jgi:hypothetical protein
MFDEGRIIEQCPAGPERVIQRRSAVGELSRETAVDELHD